MTRWTTGICRSNGIDLHYRRTGGAKPALVLLHGLLAGGACWTPIAVALEDEYDVVMPDARGHGSSGAPLHGYSYVDHAGDVVGLVDALELRDPFLLGHSMGGMTAAVVASQNSALIRGVVLVDPPFLTPEFQREVHESDVAEQHRRLLALDKTELMADLRARHPHRSPEIVELLAEARLQTRMSAFEVLAPPLPNYREVVRAIEIPSLLVIGDNPVVSLESARELQALNPRLEVEQIAGAGHGVPYDQPERLAAVVRSFLHSVPAT